MNVAQKAVAWLGQRVGLTPRDGAFWSWYGGGENWSGKSVTQHSALQLSVVWACVRLLAETIATLPLNVYKIDRAGKASIAYGDPLHVLLHDTPNAEMAAVDFWESMLASILLWGNGYATKDRLSGSVNGLTPLRPEGMTVTRDKVTGELVYRYTDQGGRVQTYAEDDVFHVRGFSLDGLIGLSPIAFARNSIGAAIALEEAAAVTFARGMRPAGMLSLAQMLKPEQRKLFQDELMAQFSGALNQGKLFLGEAGMTFTPISMNPEDAQMLQSRAFAVEDICRWYRIPPFMIGYTEKTTSWGTGLEQQNIGFLTYALRPYLKRIEQQVTRSLIPANLRATRYAEYNLDALLRADSVGRAALYASAAQNGWMSRNEIRGKENLELDDEANADKLTVQVNLVPIDKLGTVPPKTGGDTTTSSELKQ